MPQCSILAIGNEVLSGEVRDLNLYALGSRLTRLGFSVTGAAVAPDDAEAIGRSLAFLLAQAPDVVICCGGLGPTDDDLTLRAIAATLGRRLVSNERARALVEEQYEQLMARGYIKRRGPERARAKMALLPEGSIPLPNPIGTAPGVKMSTGATQIYILPGVPKELRAILAETVIPELRSRYAVSAFSEVAIRVHVDDEADVADALQQTRQRHPDVYIKSLAQPFPAASWEGIQVIATAHAATSEAACEAASTAIRDLAEALDELGYQTTLETKGG